MAVAKQVFPFLISCFITLVGGFFLFLTMVETPILKTEAPGKFYLMGLASLFVLAGFYFMIMARRGELKKKGKTVLEVRLEAVQKMKDPMLLEKIVLDEDEPQEVKDLAKKRLTELAD